MGQDPPQSGGVGRPATRGLSPTRPRGTVPVFAAGREPTSRGPMGRGRRHGPSLPGARAGVFLDALAGERRSLRSGAPQDGAPWARGPARPGGNSRPPRCSLARRYSGVRAWRSRARPLAQLRRRQPAKGASFWGSSTRVLSRPAGGRTARRAIRAGRRVTHAPGGVRGKRWRNKHQRLPGSDRDGGHPAAPARAGRSAHGRRRGAERPGGAGSAMSLASPERPHHEGAAGARAVLQLRPQLPRRRAVVRLTGVPAPQPALAAARRRRSTGHGGRLASAGLLVLPAELPPGSARRIFFEDGGEARFAWRKPPAPGSLPGRPAGEGVGEHDAAAPQNVLLPPAAAVVIASILDLLF